MSKTLFDKIQENIVVIRLDNKRHDIIGILLDQNDTDISLGNPFFVNIEESEMFPLCFLSDEKVYKFNNSRIEFIVPCNDKFKEEYLNIIVKTNTLNKKEESNKNLVLH